MSYTNKIKSYIKIIKYSKKYEVETKEIFDAIRIKQIYKNIDSHILQEALSSTKKIMDNKN